MRSRIVREALTGAVRFTWPMLGAEPERAGPECVVGPRQERDSSPGRQFLEQALAERDARWRAEVEAARAQARREGMEEGRRKAVAEVEGVMERLARSVEELAGCKPRLRMEAEREVVELALAIARRVLRRELQVDPEAILGLVKAAMEKANQREITAVRVHPAHASPVRAYLERIGAPQAIEIREDATLEPGAVIVETRRGLIDASLETQLEEIGRGLADALRPRGAA